MPFAASATNHRYRFSESHNTLCTSQFCDTFYPFIYVLWLVGFKTNETNVHLPEAGIRNCGSGTMKRSGPGRDNNVRERQAGVAEEG